MQEERKIKGSFNGIDGNAFMLMVKPRMAKMSDLTGGQRSDEYFQKLAREQGFSKEWIQKVLDEARSKDYNHLVATLLNYMEENDNG
ncbi:MAG: hypothetical protein ACRCTQ_04750 [Brevinemataceae bacterium]